MEHPLNPPISKNIFLNENNHIMNHIMPMKWRSVKWKWKKAIFSLAWQFMYNVADFQTFLNHLLSIYHDFSPKFYLFWIICHLERTNSWDTLRTFLIVKAKLIESQIRNDCTDDEYYCLNCKRQLLPSWNY